MRVALPWRMVISFLVAVLLITIIWFTSQFKEPPKITPIILVLLLIIQAVFEVIYFLQGRAFTGTSSPSTKWAIFRLAFTSMLVGTLLYSLLFYGFKYLDYWVYNSEYPNISHLKISLLTGATISIIFASILMAIRLNQAHFQKIIENERYKNELIAANLTILNQQLDPHFLFNNFNTLYYLIDENAVLAKQFLKNMAGIYRHILQSHQHGLIPAQEEYEIAKQYLEILALRYEKALLVKDHILPTDLQDKFLPPLVLQQLLENAVKHNQIDPQQPLNIMLASTATSLLVTNSLNSIISENTTGLGLKNIVSRYSYLGSQEVIIEKSDASFSVQIPLLVYES